MQIDYIQETSIQEVNNTSYYLESVAKENTTAVSPLDKTYSKKTNLRKISSDITYKIESSPELERVYVGKVHEKWQFPSDHLPIGATIGDFNIATWNVLNNVYLNWVYHRWPRLARVDDYQARYGYK